jgi:hydrogenase nickel incorporation protein HypA/HybF
MHEYSIVQALVERIATEVKARNATAVHRVGVRVGELSGVEPELLVTAFETFRAGTCCEGARLEVDYVKAAWACRECGAPIAAGEVLKCPGCGGRARLVRGDEMYLDQLELEIPDV